MLLCGPGWFRLVEFKFSAISHHRLHLHKDTSDHGLISANGNGAGSGRRQTKNAWQEDSSLVSLTLFLPTQVSQWSTSARVGKGDVTRLCNQAVLRSRENVVHTSITAWIKGLLRDALLNYSRLVKHLIKQGPRWCQILAVLWSPCHSSVLNSLLQPVSCSSDFFFLEHSYKSSPSIN